MFKDFNFWLFTEIQMASHVLELDKTFATKLLTISIAENFME